ncbi:MAG: terminase gpA endonuclease subunit [Pirellulales bacterium]
MATDPRKLRPAELCRMLNSTPLGEVVSERQLLRHRNRAGLRIGEGSTVDLLRYAAWLVQERHRPRPEPEVDPYEKIKERARARAAALAQAGRDIGELPAVANPDRKRQAAEDFRYFCESYFPLSFSLAWSPDHLKVIGKVEQAVLRGGLFAMAMPRGSGKSTICEIACIWALLYGHRDFVCLIGSDEGHAEDSLDSIKAEMAGNELLLEDFPEVVYPIHCLDGIANRASGQLYQGDRTHIGWTAREIVLPTIAGSKASGGVIRVAGITGRIRGMKFKRSDGLSVRPSLVIIDDPQTDESARSISQCASREAILAGAILGLAGPGKKIAGVMPCTVIRPGDMADNILDRKKHPEWDGERTKMVYAFPTDAERWRHYAELRVESLQTYGDIRLATEFYREQREAMDAGAIVAWPQRYEHDELSAIQHAINIRLRDEAAFFAEYQNEPLAETNAESEELSADQIAGKLNRLKRGQVPLGVEHITAFIDVQATLLFYVVVGWERDFTGYVLDYGTYPDQRRPYFVLRSAQHTLSSTLGIQSLEGAIYGGLDAATRQLLSREWPRDDGARLRVERCLVDANWGASTDVVYQFCQQSPFSAIVLPSHGRYVGASSYPFSEYRRKPGDRVGHNWRIPNVEGRRAVRHVLYDTNYWKSFVFSRLAVPMGERGCLSLFGERPDLHRLFAEHLKAEYRVKTEGRGRTVDEWKQGPERFDNHWLDCVVGCAVGGSVQGVVMPGVPKAELGRKRIKYVRLG